MLTSEGSIGEIRMSEECGALLDTSIVAAAYRSRLLREMLDLVSNACSLLVSHGYLRLDVEGSQELPGSLKRDIIEWATRTYKDAGVLSAEEELRVYGRHHRWVKRIGKLDAAIAHLAVEKHFLLVTSDWLQLQFYATMFTKRNPKSQLKAMFIPVRWIA